MIGGCLEIIKVSTIVVALASTSMYDFSILERKGCLMANMTQIYYLYAIPYSTM